MKEKIISILILICLLLSCKHERYRVYQDTMNELSFNFNSYHSILVIPNEGCTGCISYATDYVLNRIHKDDSTLVVFTNINDIKKLKLTLNSKIHYKNIMLDTMNHFSKTQISSIYPEIWTVEDNQIVSVDRFNL